MPWPRDGESWKPYGWKQRQAELLAAAEVLGVSDMRPGDHTPDEAVTVTLVSPAAGETITVWLAGRIVGEAWNNDVSRLRGRMMRVGRRDGSSVVADAPCRVYHYAHGEWGVIIYA